MKIIQISVSSAADGNGTENIYGLGEDGYPYIWEYKEGERKWVLA